MEDVLTNEALVEMTALRQRNFVNKSKMLTDSQKWADYHPEPFGLYAYMWQVHLLIGVHDGILQMAFLPFL